MKELEMLMPSASSEASKSSKSRYELLSKSLFYRCTFFLFYKLRPLFMYMLIVILLFVFMATGQRRAGGTVEVAAEAERGIATVTEIQIETGGDDTDPGRAREIAIATETESRGRGERSPPGGTSAHPVHRRTKTETRTGGRTNTWTGLRLRSLLLVTSTMARSPASCSLGALFNWKG